MATGGNSGNILKKIGKIGTTIVAMLVLNGKIRKIGKIGTKEKTWKS